MNQQLEVVSIVALTDPAIVRRYMRQVFDPEATLRYGDDPEALLAEVDAHAIDRVGQPTPFTLEDMIGYLEELPPHARTN